MSPLKTPFPWSVTYNRDGNCYWFVSKFETGVPRWLGGWVFGYARMDLGGLFTTTPLLGLGVLICPDRSWQMVKDYSFWAPRRFVQEQAQLSAVQARA